MTKIEHKHCGTPQCCGQCDTATINIEVKRKPAYTEYTVFQRIYRYFKGVAVYLKYGDVSNEKKRRV